MSFISPITAFFKKIGTLASAGLKAAHDRGLDDALIRLALPKVRELAISQISNGKRREQAVEFLTLKGIPESVARIAVELAVQIIKNDPSPAPPKTATDPSRVH